MRQRIFTLEEANQLIPWLESKFQKMGPDQERLLALFRQSRHNGEASMEVEISKAQEDIEAVRSRMREMVGEINSQGIIVRDADRGLVDFPALREGREVFLCWLRGEESIQFWHGTDEGYASRKPL